nr:MAG TPA: hypothetical protein [Caudoviricetes sp.]
MVSVSKLSEVWPLSVGCSLNLGGKLAVPKTLLKRRLRK